MSRKKKYNSLDELPFFNINKSYVKMDAARAFSVLEKSLRGEDGYLGNPQSPIPNTTVFFLNFIKKYN